MDKTAAQAELATLLSDTLSQVSDDRLVSAVTQAWRDPWVCNQIWDDTSLIFSMNVFKYDIPVGITTIDALYIKRSSFVFPEEIGSELWEVIDGQIIFNKNAVLRIPDGFTVQIRGRYKLTDTDSIAATNMPMQNYIVNLAAWIVLKQVGFSRVLAFLKNDTSMSELIAFRNLIEQDMLKYRSQLQLAYVNG